jgi:hypothetical protein
LSSIFGTFGYVRRLLAARIPELTDADLSSLAGVALA